jgi:hypothetical protein
MEARTALALQAQIRAKPSNAPEIASSQGPFFIVLPAAHHTAFFSK